MKEKKYSKFSIKYMLLMFAFIPLFVTVLTIVTIAILSFRDISKSNALAHLQSLTTASGQRLELIVDEEGIDVLRDYDKLKEMFSDVNINKLKSSYVYIVDRTGTMLYHPTEDKVGQPVENTVIKGVVSDIEAGNVIQPEVVIYDFHGTEKYAAYYCNSENDFILVMSADETDVMATANRAIYFMLGLTSVLAIIFICLVIVFSKVFTKPLNAVITNLQVLSNGDLTNEITAQSKITETQKLIDSAQIIRENWGSIISDTADVSANVMKSSDELKTTAASTLSASEEIAKAVEDVAQNNTKQATLVTDITKSLGIVEQGSIDITNNIKRIEDHTDSLYRDCETMKNRINETRSSNDVLSENIGQIQSKIETTNITIQKMSDILATIEDIASQTKLLSLNASIEAARAGDSGRGFSVVADSIRTLAASTADELISIREIIESITKNFAECNKYTSIVVENNATNQENLSEIIRIFDEVDSSISHTVDQVVSIKTAITESEDQVKQVVEEVETLGNVSESNAAASEEINASIEELTALMSGVDAHSNMLLDQSASLHDALKTFSIKKENVIQTSDQE